MIEKGEDLSGVRGIAFRTKDKVKVNDPRNMRADIDSFPLPARDLSIQITTRTQLGRDRSAQ